MALKPMYIFSILLLNVLAVVVKVCPMLIPSSRSFDKQRADSRLLGRRGTLSSSPTYATNSIARFTPG